jgi:hypothetical protein
MPKRAAIKVEKWFQSKGGEFPNKGIVCNSGISDAMRRIQESGAINYFLLSP